MKKSIIAGVSALVMIPMLVGAASVWSQNKFIMTNNETREGNVYVASQEAVIAGKITGDLVAAGGSVTVTGHIGDDVLVAAGTTQLAGTVAGDVRAASGDILLSGDVGGDVAIAGGKTYMSGGSIGGDLLMLGGEVIIDGSVAGRIHISGGKITINGPVAGNVEVQSGQLTIGETAVIGGNLRYRGPAAPMVAPGALIKGKLEFVRDDFGGERFRYFARSAGFLAGLIGLLMSLVTAIVLFACFKKQVHSLTHDVLTGFWKNAGRGLLFVIAIPIAVIILFVTIIGFPVGAFGLLLLSIGLLLSMALSGIAFGAWVARAVFKRPEHQPTLATVIWGTVALRAITIIPGIGWLFGAAFCLAGFGILARRAYHTYWVARS